VLSERGDLVALVGGVDSWVDPIGLDWLHEKGRLREGPRASGILPGEGAAFLALETPESAASRGATVRALLVSAVGATSDVPPGEPTKGRTLSAVLKRIADRQSVATPLVISDLNGERHRAFEWMFALTRGGIRHDRDFRHWNPAECVGDAGAALGAIGAAWAVGALGTDRVSEGQAIVWGASDEGAREAVLLETGTKD
jgi:3-oxoacyl-[acyl-carrier-protein] synthase-1